MRRTQSLLAVGLVGALALTLGYAVAATTMKMTTPILPSIVTPDSVESRIVTLKFFDGFPDATTAEKVYDNLDWMRGVEAFLNAMPGASVEALRIG